MSKNELLFNYVESDSLSKTNSVSYMTEDNYGTLAEDIKTQLALLELYKFYKRKFITHNLNCFYNRQEKGYRRCQF
jgi:hypothetical protein